MGSIFKNYKLNACFNDKVMPESLVEKWYCDFSMYHTGIPNDEVALKVFVTALNKATNARAGYYTPYFDTMKIETTNHYLPGKVGLPIFYLGGREYEDCYDSEVVKCYEDLKQHVANLNTTVTKKVEDALGVLRTYATYKPEVFAENPGYKELLLNIYKMLNKEEV